MSFGNSAFSKFISLIIPDIQYPEQLPNTVSSFSVPGINGIPRNGGGSALSPAASASGANDSSTYQSQFQDLISLDALSVFISGLATIIALIALMAALQSTRSVGTTVDVCNTHLTAIRESMEKQYQTTSTASHHHRQQHKRSSHRRRHRQRHRTPPSSISTDDDDKHSRESISPSQQYSKLHHRRHDHENNIHNHSRRHRVSQTLNTPIQHATTTDNNYDCYEKLSSRPRQPRARRAL